MHDLDPTVVATELPQLRIDLSGVANKKEFPVPISAKPSTPPTVEWLNYSPSRQRDFMREVCV
jgi:hypothetical protein